MMVVRMDNLLKIMRKLFLMEKKQDQSHPALVHPGILQTTIIHKQERPDNHDPHDHDNKNKIDDGVWTGSNQDYRDHDNKHKNIDGGGTT